MLLVLEEDVEEEPEQLLNSPTIRRRNSAKGNSFFMAGSLQLTTYHLFEFKQVCNGTYLVLFSLSEFGFISCIKS